MDLADLQMRFSAPGARQTHSDMDRLTGAAQRAGDQADRLERRSNRLNAAFTGLSRTLAPLAASMAAAFGVTAIVRTIADFEKSMAAVAAITGATEQELASLRDTARELGATTEFSAAQAADGLRFLGMAGFEASEAVAAIPSVLDLATAASMGLAEAADISSNVMSGFGIAAQDAARVADVLAAASSSANTDVSQLGQAMSTVAPIAASLGISLEDTAAAIGIMSDAGIQGSRAGTGLRGVLASLAGPTTAAQEALAEMGLTVEAINPQTNELSVVMGRLRAAGMTTAQAMAIFGREASSAALILADNAQKVGEFGDELRGAEGAAAEMAGTIRDQVEGDLKNLASAVSELILALGNAGLTAAIRFVVQTTTEFVRMISSATAVLDRLSSYAMAAAVAGAIALRGAIVSATVAAYGFVRSLVATRAALIRLGIGAVVVLAGELIYQFTQLVSETGSFGAALETLKNLALEVWERIKFGAMALGREVAAAAYDIQAAFVRAFQGIARGMADTIGRFDPLVRYMANAAADSLEDVAKKAEAEAGVMRAGAEALAKGALAPLESLASLRTLMDANDEAAEAAAAALENLNETLANAAVAGEGGSKAYKKFREALQGVMNEAFPTIAAMEELAEKQALIARGVADGLISAEMGEEAMRRLAESYRDAINPLEAVWRGLEEERALIAMTAQERAIHTQMLQLENELRQAGIVLTQQQRAELEQEVRSLQQTREATDNYNNSVQELGRSIDSSFDQMTDALARGENAWEALGRIAINVLEDIIMHVLQANDAFGGGGQSFGSAIAQGIASLFHSGGIVGQPTATRMVSPLAFAGAPRMHSGGIAGDEVPAILKRGEEVLPENHPRHRNNAGGGDVRVNLNVINNAPVEVSHGEPRSDGNGGVAIDVMVDELVGRKLSQFGSHSNKSARAAFGLKPMTARR